MKRFTLTFFLLAMLTVGSVHAQVYKSKDEHGRTIFSDKPPAGQVKRAPSQPINEEEPTAKPAASQAKPATPAQTLADKEMEFRKRQKEQAEQAEKDKKEQAEAARKQEQCSRMRRYLQLLESGERIATRDAQGEKSYMEDSAREREIAKTRQSLQECRE